MLEQAIIISWSKNVEEIVIIESRIGGISKIGAKKTWQQCVGSEEVGGDRCILQLWHHGGREGCPFNMEVHQQRDLEDEDI
jgi:hypothetical protein